MFKVFCFIIIALVVREIRSQGVDIDRLLSEMDESEKCGQMTQITFDPIEKDKIVEGENPVDTNKLAEQIRRFKIGSVLNAAANIAQTGKLWQDVIKTIQDYALKEKRKIPILYGLDSIHGANYIREAVLFPQPLSMAASFNLEIAKKVAEITSIETRATGIPWNFNPVLDIGRQPLWPRLYETYGEDVHLAIKMGEAYIEGHHGPNKDLSKKYSGTCLKHYIGYSYPFNGKDRTPAVIPEITLREYFLPPFAHGVKAGSPTVMVNSGDVNGIPGHANSFYINDILKGELKFDGFVVSDWEDIIRLYTRDKVASSVEETVRISVMAGLDMSMTPYNGSIFFDHCVNLAKKDKAFANRVNDAVRRILKVKKQFGLFENPYPNPDDLKLIGTAESEEFNLKAASESIILAKNSQKVLPLNKNAKVLVTGPASNLLKVLNGGWTYTWQGDIESNYIKFGRKKTTIWDEIIKKTNQAVYEAGADFDKTLNLQNVKDKASTVDYVILCIGEATYTETPGNINSLLISSAQEELANALFSVGKPVIVVYLGGRPRVMTNIANKAAAVILGFLPGTKGSEAIANIIFGDYNPNGKLPITYPSSPNGFLTYDYKPMEVYDVNIVEWLYPFGHGLSYTSFTYSNLRLNKRELNGADDKLQVSIDVKNTGNLAGMETVLLYIHDEFGTVSRPVKQLKGFNKQNYLSGEQKTITFTLNMYDLSFINQHNHRVAEAGSFRVYVDGFNGVETFQLKSTIELDKSTKNSASGYSFFGSGFSFVLSVFIAFYKLF